MKITFAEFRKMFYPTWIDLLSGWRGFGQYQRLLDITETREFAREKLEVISNPVPELSELAAISDADEEHADALLSILASPELADYENSKRRWIALLLSQRLEELPSDPLYGLIGLTEFWSDAGFPSYSPHEIQGKGNEISPQDYYTKDNYDKAVERHKRWLSNELETLQVGLRANGSMERR
ncbi:MAG TPA: DUF2247 family protein [Blastocatellia bacterium]|nr:DUF2247 family protein [Blastocatellia bacterium]